MNHLIQFAVFGTYFSVLCVCGTRNLSGRSIPFLKKFLGTKTPYFFKHESIQSDIHWHLGFDGLIKDHIPLYVDTLFRHGTRYPSDKKMTKWKNHLRNIKVYDSKDLLTDTLKLWDDHFPEHLSYTLHEKGWHEVGYLAETLYNMTKSFFDSVNASEVTVLSSPKVRVKASACAFFEKLSCLMEKTHWDECDTPYNLSGQFSKLNNTNFNDCGGAPIILNTHLLRPFDHCKRYIHSVEENKTASFHMDDFAKSVHANAVVHEVSKGFDRMLTWNEVRSLYEVCAFQYALHEHDSVCSLFEKRHLEVMEYISDLKHYYKTGYGYDINYQLSCQLLQDIIEQLDHADDIHRVNATAKTPPVLRFGHAETLIPLLCLLGLYKDEHPLTNNSYAYHRENRLFRTGTFSPFAGNVLFILYTDNLEFSQYESKLALIVNGRAVKLPDADCYLCEYYKIRKLLMAKLNVFSCSTVCTYDKHVHDEL